MCQLSAAESGVVYAIRWENNGNQPLYVVGCKSANEEIFQTAASLMQHTLHEAEECQEEEECIGPDN